MNAHQFAIHGSEPLRRSTPLASTRARTWTGRALTALVALFLAFDAIVKLLRLPMVLDANAQLGLPASSIVPIGVLALVLLAIYLIPRTALIGAVLWTGYLGGAIAIHVRAGSPTFSVVFPLLIAALLWGGLALRDNRVRALISPS